MTELVVPKCRIEERNINAGVSQEVCLSHDQDWPGCDRGGLPWILLDVDGVINAFPTQANIAQQWSSGKACPDTGVSFLELKQTEPLWGMKNQPDTRKYQITWDPTIIERLVKFQTDGLARIAWLTTWGEGARGELSELLGLPDFPCFHHPTENDLYSHHRWWKFSAIIREFEEHPHEKIVWLDDDLVVERAAREWAQERGYLAIAPFQHEGLTHEHLDRIEAYLTTTLDEFRP